MTQPLYDAPALPALIEVMRAANFHDLPAVVASTDEVLAIIARQPRHKARPDVLAARDHAEAGEWVGCWAAAYQAICGLTHAFPPDLLTCPPTPDNATARTTRTCSSCMAALPLAGNFCALCGTPAT